DIASRTEFNTQNLLSGDFEGVFHIGANQGQNMDVSIDAMDAEGIGLNATTVKVEVSTISEGTHKVVENDDFDKAGFEVGKELTVAYKLGEDGEATETVAGVKVGSDYYNLTDFTSGELNE